MLEAKGWEVLRIPYEPPLTGKALQKILETIKDFVGPDDE
jgi:hypothetical protein